MLSVLQACLYLQRSRGLRKTLCFLPSASHPSLDLIIIVIHCEHVQAHRLEKLCMLIPAEKLLLWLILETELYSLFLLSYKSSINILLSYSSTSFMLPLHQTDWYQKWRGRSESNLQNKLRKYITLLQSTFFKEHWKWFQAQGKKNPKWWESNANFHCQEIIIVTCQKWAEKLRSQAATCNSSDHFSVTALDNDQTRKSIR